MISPEELNTLEGDTMPISFCRRLPGPTIIFAIILLAMGAGLATAQVDYNDTPRVVATFDVGDGVRDFQVRGQLAYIVRPEGFVDVWDLSDPAQAFLVASHAVAGQPTALHFRGDTAIIGTVDRGLVAADLSDPLQYVELDALLPAAGGLLLGLVGDLAVMSSYSGGETVIDVSDPTNLQVAGTFQSPGLTWRSFCAYGEVGYATCQMSGVMVFDFSDPANVELTANLSEYDSSFAGGVSIVGDHLYAATTRGLYAFDLADPRQPQFLGEVNLVAETEFVAAGPNRMACAGSSSLLIFDLADPAAPLELGGAVVSEDVMGAAHLNGHFATIADESTLVIVADCSTPAIPVLAEVPFPVPGSYWDVVGSRMIVGDSPGAQVAMVDISDPDQPQVVGQFQPCEPYLRDVRVNNSLAVAVSDSAGLFLYDWPQGGVPVQAGEYHTDEELAEVVLDGDLAYVVAKRFGLIVLDVADPWNPQEIGRWEANSQIDGTVQDLTIEDGLAVTSFGYFQGFDYYRYTKILDISDPTDPQLITSMAYDPYGVLHNRLLVRPDGYYSNTMRVISLADPANPQELATITSLFDSPRPLGFDGTRFYYREFNVGLVVYDLAQPESPQQLASTFVRSYQDGKADEALWMRSVRVDGLKALPFHGEGATAIEPDDPADELPPSGLELRCHPNPFNPRLNVVFSVQRPGPVDVSVYDLRGRHVATVYEGDAATGPLDVVWDGRSAAGADVASGTYLVKLRTEQRQLVRKVALVR